MRLPRTSTSRIALWLAAPIGIASLIAATSTPNVSEPAAPVAVAAPAPAPLPAPAPATTPDAAAAGKYIGAAKCKNCHSAEKTGDQYGHWEKMLHAKAFETLASDKAKELAKAKGIDDPQKADACLECHVTAFREPAETIDKGFKQELGVQCESCHGPGEAHRRARMASAAQTDPSKETPVSPTEINAKPNIETCHRCHNSESPTYKPFCFKESFGKIVHLIPHKKRTPEQLKKETDPFGCGDAGSCQCPQARAAEPK